MVLSWFDAKEAKEFGKSLAQFYIDQIPVGMTGGDKKTLIRKKEALDKLFNKMAHFKREHKLNIYKKAQLGNAFKWSLEEAGYDPKYVDQLTKELMVMR